MPINILLVENQSLVRLGIRSIFSSQKDLEIIKEANSSEDGFEQFKLLKPDVTILSLRMPDSCAVDELDRYFDEDPKAKIIVLAEHSGDVEIKRSLEKGALGYVLKDISEEDLIRAVKIVNAGKKFIPSEIANVLSENLGTEDLTKTEQRVLQMIVGGMSNKEISFALDVSENTTKTHVKNIFDKLNVSDRTSATTTAIRRGLVRIDF